MKHQAGQLSRFLMVGLLAFILDGVVLSLLVYQFLVLLVAFYLPGRFTFQAIVSIRSLVKYGGLQGVSACLNVLAYSLWLSYGFSYGAPIVGLIIGSLLATLCNFLGNKFYVFQDVQLNAPTGH